MTKITRDQVLKLADLSKIKIDDEEIDKVAKQLEDVLTYAERVKEIAADIQIDLPKNTNVFADDIIQRTDPLPILAQAPDCENNLYVVPKILDDTQ